MRTLAIDLETYSSNDIKYSVYKYVEAPDFEILLFAYAFDDDPVRVVDLAQGETLPDDVKAALYDKDVLKTAFNANFEINCLRKYFPDLLEEQWECDRILSLYNSYPPHLAAVAKAMHFDEDRQKDTRGKALIRYFCLPCKPTKANGGRTRNYPKDAPDKWEIFKEYNRQDVVVERAIRDKLVNLRPPDFEHENWLIDQAINRNGIMVNQTLVDNAIRLSGEYREKLLARAMEITGLDNPNSPLQVKGWLEERLGRAVDSLSKAAVADMLAEDIPGDVREMLSIRQKISKSSIKKYDAMRMAACQDSRIRGMFQFYGAARTGRFAGRIVQLQNLPRNSMPDLDLARNMVLDGDLEALEMCYDDVQDVLSQLIRTALEAPPGKRFIVADFSAIEARVIAWLAGEEWEMKAFAEGKDIYCATASAMFGVPVVKHKVNAHLRQKGKVATLACIAEGQEVLTDRGLVPIEKVTKDMKVWDGENFVTHDGVVYQGAKDCISINGIYMTPDHLILTEKGWRHASESGGFNWANVRLPNRYASYRKSEQESSIFMPLCLWPAMCPFSAVPQTTGSANKIMWLSPLGNKQQHTQNAWNVSQPNFPYLAGNYRPLSLPKLQRLEKLWRPRNQNMQTLARQLRKFFGRHGTNIQTRFTDRQNRQQPGIFTGKLSLGYTERKCQKQTHQLYRPRIWQNISRIIRNFRGWCGNNQAPNSIPLANRIIINPTKVQKKVYDIKNCGPKHRFAVYDTENKTLRLTHNCGYGGGIGALKAMGADKMGLTDEELQTVVRKWREASPHIVKLWADVENAAMNAVSGIPTTIRQKSLYFHVEDDALYIELPSGRHLVYLHPHLGQNRFGSDAILYTGLGGSKTTAGRWGTLETYGGKLSENLVQAIARDCLCAAMKRLTDAGYKICAHIHDEVILEMPEGKGSLDDAVRIMCQNEAWNEGLVLNADGFEAKYYQKD